MMRQAAKLRSKANPGGRAGARRHEAGSGEAAKSSESRRESGHPQA
ncbi:hypothetical protein J2Z22_004536 [Paenibacillus forsythiae]|uniref:Uncharacterized protein n=1 Tax=Paenibacillus forsythiae TaxID=365616 RepID=A0ABU3HGZ6_9BACL|nr:hypothetical protein [Paenibacillus forsythiae]MDT3428940.1 hypothetical protein [Paenibacillus forsythiae]